MQIKIFDFSPSTIKANHYNCILINFCIERKTTFLHIDSTKMHLIKVTYNFKPTSSVFVSSFYFLLSNERQRAQYIFLSNL
jgi:hypothetical protein